LIFKAEMVPFRSDGQVEPRNPAQAASASRHRDISTDAGVDFPLICVA
jgi:hypothetical protein